MKQRHRLTIPILAGLILTLATVTATCASLDHSVLKYKNNRISQSDVERLAQFDHLIRYFAGFSYFIPRVTVNPDFVRALILAESGAMPSAVSVKNALGLGQILPSTGEQAARELAQTNAHFRYVRRERLENLSDNDLFDPAINILLTCYLVAKYNYKFDGKLELVVSAWNAGENTESLGRGEHAPYQETEDLIGKVNAYFLYLLRYRPLP